MKLLDNLYWKSRMAIQQFWADESGLQVVELVVIMGIGILLAIFFKKEISELIDTLMTTITGNATGTVNTPVNP